MNKKEALVHLIQGCSIAAIKDVDDGDYYIGCSQCKRPVKIESGITIFSRTIFRKNQRRVKEKGTPNC